MENKWAFLVACESAGVPVSPTLDLAGVCVKHRNEEGGLGIHFYRSASEGGDWIIQPVLRNAGWVREKVSAREGARSAFVEACTRLETATYVPITNDPRRSGRSERMVPSAPFAS